MTLWNDYEGKTIAGKYLLGSLIGPEGRSALFALMDGAGAPGTIAVTESLNDEEQMLGCWTKIAGVKQENLLALREFGRTELEGAPLTYVVMETPDGTLADLLKERVATKEEAVQIAVGLTGALEALHREGIAHGHVTAENVVAVGEMVKLRTDCIRDCAAKATTEEWNDLRWKDVQALSLLLLRVLTLEKKLSPETKLVAPFDRVVEKGINGSWGLTEIRNAVDPPVFKTVMPLGPVAPVAAPVVAPVQYSLPTMGAEVVPELDLPVRRVEVPMDSVGSPTFFGFDWKVLAGGACALLVLILLGVHFFGGKPEKASVAAPAVVEAPAGAPAPVAKPSAASVADAAHSVTAGHMQAGWYVIAYTYNREEEAWKKVASIMKKHPELQPEVVAPGRHGPFLVAIGGPMTREGAASVRIKAMREGMPRDTFVRNYTGG